MGDGLIKYIEWVEVESFFSAYLLLYLILYFVESNKNKLTVLLPLSYAIVGTLYLALQLKNGFNYNITVWQLSYLKAWAFLSILFWIPVFRKKVIFSVLHSLVFFFLMMQSIYNQIFIPNENDEFLSNNFKILSASLIINLISFSLLAFIFYIRARSRKTKG